MIIQRLHKSHTIANRLSLLALCAIIFVTTLFVSNPLSGMHNAVTNSLVKGTTLENASFSDSNLIAFGEEEEEEEKEKDKDKDKDKEEDSTDEESSSEADSTTNSFVKVSQKVSENPSEYIEGEDNQLSGNYWSALGGTSRFFAFYTKATKVVAYADLAQGITDSKEQTSSDTAPGLDKEKSKEVYGVAGYYGYALHSTGLMHSLNTGSAEEIFVILGRVVVGFTAMFAYAIQVAVNYIFGLIIDLADWINVFKWITEADVPKDSPFKGLQDIVVGLYDTASSVGLLLATLGLGLGIALAIFGWKFSSTNKRTKESMGIIQTIGRYLFRVFIIILTPLVLGSVFTSILDETKGAYKGASGSDYAIYSNLIDYSNWVKHSRLALPDGTIHGLIASGGADVIPITHQKTLKINTDGAGLENAKKVSERYADEDILGKNGISLDTAKKDDTLNEWSLKVLWRWSITDKYRASQYEAYVKNNSKIKVDNDEDLASNKKFVKAISTDGSLRGFIKGNFRTDVAKYNYGEKADGKDNVAIGDITEGNRGGLSSLGMYNFLSTTFDDKGMVYTDATSMVGQNSTPYHSSVGLVGRGFVAMGNGALMLALIFSMSILGVMFAIFAINALMVSIPKIISNLVATSLGNTLRFIKLVLAVFVVGLELVGGAILYTVSQYIISGLASVGDKMIENDGVLSFIGFSLGNGSSLNEIALSGAGTSVVYGSMNLGMAVLILFVSVRLVTLRGQILGIFGQMIESFLNTLFGMFDSTAQAQSNAFQNGNNGLYTTDDKGKNQLTNMDGSPSDFSSGSFNKGSQERGSKSSGFSPLGKLHNAKSGVNDAIRAEEQRLERPLSGKEKAKVMAKEATARGTANAIQGAGAVLGSKSLQGVGKDLQSVHDSKIEDKLAKAKETEAMREGLRQDALKDETGYGEEVDRIRNHQEAVNGEFSADGYGDGTSYQDPSITDDSSTGIHDSTAPNIDDSNANSNDSNEFNGYVPTGSNGDVTASDGSAIVPVPLKSQSSGAQDLVSAKQAVSKAEDNLAKAKSSGSREMIENAEKNLVKAQDGLKQAEANVADYIDNPNAPTALGNDAKTVAPIKSEAEAQTRLAETSKNAQDAQMLYEKMRANPSTSPRAVANAQKSAISATQVAMATQKAVADYRQQSVQGVQGAQGTQQQAVQQQGVQGAQSVQQQAVQQAGQQMVQQTGQQQVTQQPPTQTLASGGSLPNQPSSPTSVVGAMPMPASYAEASKSINQAKHNFHVAQAKMNSLPKPQQEAFAPTLHKAEMNMLAEQSRGLNYYDSQPATQFAVAKTTRSASGAPQTSILSNKQAHGHIKALRDAHVNIANLTSSKASRQEIQMATNKLEAVKKSAVQSGIRKEIANNPAQVSKAMKQMVYEQNRLVNGTPLETTMLSSEQKGRRFNNENREREQMKAYRDMNKLNSRRLSSRNKP